MDPCGIPFFNSHGLFFSLVPSSHDMIIEIAAELKLKYRPKPESGFGQSLISEQKPKLLNFSKTYPQVLCLFISYY